MNNAMRAAALAGLIALIGLAACAGPQARMADEPSALRQEAAAQTLKGERDFARGRYDKALAHIDEALRLLRAVEDIDGTALLILNRAAVLIELGRLKEAMEAAAEVHGAGHVPYPPALRARAAFIMGRASLGLGGYDDAAIGAERALDICRTGRTAGSACHDEALYMNLKARALFLKGAYEDAAITSETALKGMPRGDAGREAANALRTRADALFALMRHAEALALYGRALEIDKLLGLPGKIALDLLGMGDAAMALGDSDSARAYYIRALEVSRSAGEQAAARRALEALR